MAIRVLLADDSESLRRVMKLVLRSEPDIQLVGEARDYDELLTMLSDLAPDVVIMDIHMPNGGRVEPESVKARLATSRLLAISFANNPELASHAKKFGAVRRLDKIELGHTHIPAIKDCLQERTKEQSAS
jgi:two-component system NarL family response regulator